MALNLDLSYTQSNDAVTLTITDASGTYSADNTTGWGSPNRVVTDIVISTDKANSGTQTHLLLDVTVTDKDGTETTYTQINLWDHNGGAFTTAADLTWEFTPADFVSGGTAMGTATDTLTDGLYAISYKLVDNDSHATINDFVSETIIIDGAIRIAVYDKLRQIPTDYDCEDNDRSKDIMEALLSYSYLQSIDASASVSMSTELVNMLYTLDKLVSDGSHYTW